MFRIFRLGAFGATRVLLACVVASSAISAYAAPVHYGISSKECTVTFTATQNGSPLKGSFESVEGSVVYDEDKPETSSTEATVKINIGGPVVESADILKTLVSADWLNVTSFNTAHFSSTSFTPAEDGKGYLLKGELTLKGVKHPIQGVVTSLKAEGGVLTALASFQLDRREFNIGWKETENVGAMIDVNVKIVARAKTSG